MEKPVVFFSHSGKDKKLLMPIREKLENSTCNTLNIFMSSDGQSIPFGKNWIAQVEKGLQEARLMFVFVTPASLDSGWIYFETGYAYGKEIKVVPVGIGVSIGGLKPPINMLQGFDITSGESLNNLITIINREFSCNFKPCFDENDYLSLTENGTKNTSLIHDTFNDISGIIVPNNNQAEMLFSKIKNHFLQQELDVSCIDHLLLVGGLRVEIIEKAPPTWTYTSRAKEYLLELSLSTYNFLDSFEMLKQIAISLEHNMLWLKCSMFINYGAIEKVEDISAFVSKNPNKFSYSINQPYCICYKKKFYVNLHPEDDGMISGTETKIQIGFNPNNISGIEFVELVSTLLEIGIIYECE